MDFKRTFGSFPWLTTSVIIFIPAAAVLVVIFAALFSGWAPAAGKFVNFPTISTLQDALGDDRYRVLLRQLTRAWVVATVDVLLALPAAHYLVRNASGRTRLGIPLLLMLPFFTGSTTRAFAWTFMFGQSGPLGWSCRFLGISDNLRHTFVHNEFAVLIAMISSTLPFALFPIIGMMARIPPNMWNLAADCGLGPCGEFLVVALPLARLGILFGWIASCVVSTLSSAEIELIGGAGHQSLTRVMSDLFNRNDPTAAIAMGLLLFFGVVLTILGVVGLDRFVRKVRLPRLVELPGFKLAELSTIFLALTLVLAPAVSVVGETVVQLFRMDGRVQGFNDPGVLSLFADPRILSAIGNSVAVSIGVAIPVTLAALAGALSWWQKRSFLAMIIIGLSLSAIPGETYSIGLFMLFKLLQIDVNPVVSIALAEIVWIFPFSLITISTGLAGIRESELLAAEGFGASNWVIFYRLLLSRCWPEIVIATIISSVLSINEVSRVYFLNGSSEFLSEYIAGRLRSGADSRDYVLASLAIGLAAMVLLSILLCWLFSTSRKIVGLRGSLPRSGPLPIGTLGQGI